MSKTYNKIVFLIIGLLVILAIFFAILINRSESLKDTELKYLENNSYNTFNTVNINPEEMPALYLFDYKNYLLSDIDKAYSLLDDVYRQNRFPTLNMFKEYAKNLNFDIQVDSYDIEIKDNNYIFYVTTNNIKFTFITTGVMQYTVIIN